MMTTLDRPASEIIQDVGTPLVVLNTGYAALTTGGVARPDGLRTSLSATVGGVADFQNSYGYDSLLRMTGDPEKGS